MSMSFNGFVRVSYGLDRNKKYMQNKNKTRPSAPIFSENLTINNQFILHGLISSYNLLNVFCTCSIMTCILDNAGHVIIGFTMPTSEATLSHCE